MWPARKSTGEMREPHPEAPSFAVSGHNSTDLDYAYDAQGRPMATGLLVTPRAGAEPPEVRNATVERTGRIARVVRIRRPGRPAMVWVDFPLSGDPDRTLRVGFREGDLLLAVAPR